MSGNPVNDNGNAQGGDFLQHKNFASELLTIQATDPKANTRNMTHHREDVASPEGSGEGIGPCADPTQRADQISQETKSTTTPQEQRKTSFVQPSDPETLVASLRKQNTELKRMLAVLHDEKEQARADLQETEEKFSKIEIQLRSDMRRLQEDRAALRSSLQPPDFDGSDRIISRFLALNRAIEEWCTGASEEILANVVSQADPKLEPTTLDIADLAAFKAVVMHGEASDGMYSSTSGQYRPLEIVVDFALRSVFCRMLLECIFDRFHPGLGIARDPKRPKRSAFDKTLRELYGSVRLADPQAVSGRWRTSSFKAIAAPESDALASNLIPSITQLLLHDVRQLMEAIHGRQLPGQILHEHVVVEAAEVVKLAYDWNQDVKSKDVLLEYHPFGVRNGGSFRPERMDFLQRPSTDLAPSRDVVVLCGLSLGLETSQAVGGGKPPVYVLHSKAKVITRQFFDEM